MKEYEIKTELELCIRCYIDAKERSNQKSLDEFDNLRILEVSFNRLFLSVEHLCNAIILVEKGNFSKKHFGDYNKLKDLNEKYGPDLQEIYRATYSFRSYGDYRKFPEIEESFNQDNLIEHLNVVSDAISKCLNTISEKLDVSELTIKLKKKNEPPRTEVRGIT